MRSSISILLLSTLAIGVFSTTEFASNTILTRGDLYLVRPAETRHFSCPTLNIENILIGNEVRSGNLAAEKGMTTTLSVKTIRALHKELHIAADVNLRQRLKTDLLIAPQLSSHGEFLWQMSSYEDFEKEKVQGWNLEQLSQCSGNLIQQSKFLGGPCSTSFAEITKTFSDLPSHKHIKIEAKYHMFDNWEGEFGYMKVNGETVWTHNGEVPKDEHGINFCGAEVADPAYNIPIQVVLPHADDQIEITFGSSLTKEPCEASYAVDDVMVSVR